MAAVAAAWLCFLVFQLASLDVLAQNKANTTSPSLARLTEVPSVSFSIIPDHDLKQTDKSKLDNTSSEESPDSPSQDMLAKSTHIQSDQKSLDPDHLKSAGNSQDNSNLDNSVSKIHSPRLFQSISTKPPSHLLATDPNSPLHDLNPHVTETSMTLTTVPEDAQLHTSAPKPSFQQPISEATEEINTNNLPDEDLDDDELMEDKVGEETVKVSQAENDNTKNFPAGPVPKNESENSHFFAYLVTTAIVVAALYIAYHNKRKIIAFALEGKKSKVIRRPKSSDYQRLDQKI